jgi:hypothetical protein
MMNWFSPGGFIAGLFKGPLNRVLDSVDHKIDNVTERERVKSQLIQTYFSSQVAILTGRGWWFPLLFLVPAGFWFASVCIYSVLFCTGCAYPQDWTVAALPPPLDSWMGAIVSSLFIGKAGGELISRLRK